MDSASKRRISAALLALSAALALAGCATAAVTADVTPTAAESTPTPTPVVSEIPENWRTVSPWIVYPDGFECQGTEGCPNDFRSNIGEPSDPLPDGVEMYDPEKHDGRLVWPREQSPVMSEGNTYRLDGTTPGWTPENQ